MDYKGGFLTIEGATLRRSEKRRALKLMKCQTEGTVTQVVDSRGEIRGNECTYTQADRKSV
jgi:hypothetical protein